MCGGIENEKQTATYYERGKRWNSYEYKGVVGIQPISWHFGVPVPHLRARMKKGWSLEEAVTYIKPIGRTLGNRIESQSQAQEYEPINFTDVVAKMRPSNNKYIKAEKGSEPEWEPCKEKNMTEPKEIYSMKDYQKSDQFPFPEKMPRLWQLALGIGN